MADASNDWTGGNPFLGQNNPYLQANIDAASADLVKNWNLAELPAWQKAAVASGSYGNTAIDELTRAGQDTLQKNLGNLSNSARLQDYRDQQGMYQWDQAFNKSIYDTTFNQGQQNLQTGMNLLTMLNGMNQQDIANSTTQQNTPLDYWKQFTQQANSVGQGYGTSTGTTGSTSNPAMEALGAGYAGYNLWNRAGSGGGSSDGGITGTGGGNAGPYSTGTTLNNNQGGGYSWGGWGG